MPEERFYLKSALRETLSSKEATGPLCVNVNRGHFQRLPGLKMPGHPASAGPLPTYEFSVFHKQVAADSNARAQKWKPVGTECSLHRTMLLVTRKFTPTSRWKATNQRFLSSVDERSYDRIGNSSSIHSKSKKKKTQQWSMVGFLKLKKRWKIKMRNTHTHIAVDFLPVMPCMFHAPCMPCMFNTSFPDNLRKSALLGSTTGTPCTNPRQVHLVFLIGIVQSIIYKTHSVLNMAHSRHLWLALFC